MDPVRDTGLERFVLPGRKYHTPLPAELVPFYCYTRDGGHSIIVILADEVKAGESPTRFAVPAPVKMVLRAGWEMRDGWPWCTLPYGPETGLVNAEQDAEF